MDNEYLTAEFSEEEIKESVWSCDETKSSGPDDFNIKFIKNFWEVVKEDFVKFIREFHANGKLVGGVNPSFIVNFESRESARVE